ncbi:MAG: glycoside hydrolase family 43 protein [Puniceicoccales bacterium]|jgi:beta-xylosidase|nr:glycoside hydrolase family 43 protein [Puniceicoccales bacterium]
MKSLLRSLFSLCVAITSAFALSSAAPAAPLIPTADICVRDPFIYADAATRTYYLYVQSENRPHSKYKGVEVYTSKDLRNWTAPRRVLDLDALGIRNIHTWAPEMHYYDGAYYLFTTLTFRGGAAPVKGKDAKVRHGRGTWIFRATSPAGPFKPLKDAPHTPPEWMALDGTLYVSRDRKPWLVFCHEWVQVRNGTIEAVPLKQDLSDTIGSPTLLFRAGDAPNIQPNKLVTDGPFLYRSPKSGALFMIWSSFLKGKDFHNSDYCVLLTKSASGEITGPWGTHTPLYSERGGHGMLFKDFNGRFLLSFHQPNHPGGKERLKLFEIEDTGETLRLKSEY